MKKSRFTEEQIIGFLKQAEAGMPIKELCRKVGSRLRAVVCFACINVGSFGHLPFDD